MAAEATPAAADMSDRKMLVTTAGIALFLVFCLIVAGLHSRYLAKKQNEAHMEALIYLGDVIRRGADHAADPSEIRNGVGLILEYLEFFAQINMYCAFSKESNVVCYEDVRECLAAVDVDAKPVEDLKLGRL